MSGLHGEWTILVALFFALIALVLGLGALGYLGIDIIQKFTETSEAALIAATKLAEAGVAVPLL